MGSHLIIVGGFLGAGKTTLILRAAELLRRQGRSVGVITNDQGSNLVDTALVGNSGFPVAEVPAGCFCCRFDALIAAARRLDEQAAPDVILAEPVGSCTDLNATVVWPLERLYQQEFSLAPLSIAVDARRLLRFIHLDGTAELHGDLAYLFAKQLEEAACVVLNKCDLLPSSDREFLQKWLRIYGSSAQILPVSGLTGEGMAAWITQALSLRPSFGRTPPFLLDLDYARYGQAEARLGWFNASGRLYGDTDARAQEWAERMFQSLVTALDDAHLPIAHVKLLVQSVEGTPGPLLKASATGPSPAAIEWDSRDATLAAQGLHWLLNARVDAPPEKLESLLADTLIAEYASAQASIESLTCFQPTPPRPQYRYTKSQVSYLGENPQNSYEL